VEPGIVDELAKYVLVYVVKLTFQKSYLAILVTFSGGSQIVRENAGVTKANGFCMTNLAYRSRDSTSNLSQKILRMRCTNATLTPLLRFIAGKKLRSEVSSHPRKSSGWRSRDG
jgi:hypothetical protein